MPSWTRGRVALVGDAAACPSFLAGQGSALAMVESYTLAAELARADDHREAFARYEERLAPFLRSKQDAATGLGVAFAPKSRLQLLLRNTVMKLMGLPKVADLAMGRSFRDAVELPDVRRRLSRPLTHMVRPRFAKLAPEQQQAILRAALEEFAAHGFHDASLNRVIEAAGISKGSMYYYFDGKEDLYAYVTRTELERLFAGLGPLPGAQRR